MVGDASAGQIEPRLDGRRGDELKRSLGVGGYPFEEQLEREPRACLLIAGWSRVAVSIEYGDDGDPLALVQKLQVLSRGEQRSRPRPMAELEPIWLCADGRRVVNHREPSGGTSDVHPQCTHDEQTPIEGTIVRVTSAAAVESRRIPCQSDADGVLGSIP